jgi:hypothetical protein
MTIEQRLRDALHGTDDYQPNADLFAKVKRSIEEDAAHRRRIYRIVLGTVVFLGVVAAWFALWWNPQPDEPPLPWWSVVAVGLVIMVAIVVVLGPAIRRFSHAYTDDIFRTSPGTGRRFRALFDVAYYLVFIGMILLFVPFSPDPSWTGPDGFATLLEEGTILIGVLLLAMGILHAITVFILPMTGLVFAANLHRAKVHETKDEWPPEVRRAHRTVNIGLVVLAVWIAINVIPLVLMVVLGILFES